MRYQIKAQREYGTIVSAADAVLLAIATLRGSKMRLFGDLHLLPKNHNGVPHVTCGLSLPVGTG